MFFSFYLLKKTFRPDLTASLKALAINIGFFDWAIALFIKTPSQPNSIAMHASDKVPMPASTITGTFVCLIIMKYLFYFVNQVLTYW